MFALLLVICFQAAADLLPVQGEKGFPVRRSTDGWTDLEDEVLQRAHQKHGGEGWGKGAKGKWVMMSEYFKRWDNEDCWNRWDRSIKPGIKHQPWTPEEDQKVSISIISQFIPSLVSDTPLLCKDLRPREAAWRDKVDSPLCHPAWKD